MEIYGHLGDGRPQLGFKKMRSVKSNLHPHLNYLLFTCVQHIKLSHIKNIKFNYQRRKLKTQEKKVKIVKLNETFCSKRQSVI